MRCTTTEAAYIWPNGAPYDGGTPVTWKVTGYDSHAVAEQSRRQSRSLCGFSWAEEEGRAWTACQSAASTCGPARYRTPRWQLVTTTGRLRVAAGVATGADGRG